MPIVSQRIVFDLAQADGRRNVKYEYTDHLNIKHESPIKRVSALIDAGADLLASIPDIELQLMNKSISLALEKIKQGINPLRDSLNNPQNLDYADYATAATKIVRHLLSLDANDLLEYRVAAGFLDNIADSTLATIVPEVSTATIRQWQINLKAAGSSMAGFARLL